MMTIFYFTDPTLQAWLQRVFKTNTLTITK